MIERLIELPMREDKERTSRTPTGLDRTSEREVALLGENYRLKEKINRIIEHAEETIGELQVEIDQTKRYYLEREEKMQSMMDGIEKELTRSQSAVAVLSRDLEQERTRVTKASHYIEMQEKSGWDVKVEHGHSLGSTVGNTASHHLVSVVDHSQTSSPSSTPLKVKATSPLRIDVSEFAPASPDTSVLRGPVSPSRGVLPELVLGVRGLGGANYPQYDRPDRARLSQIAPDRHR